MHSWAQEYLIKSAAGADTTSLLEKLRKESSFALMKGGWNPASKLNIAKKVISRPRVVPKPKAIASPKTKAVASPKPKAVDSPKTGRRNETAGG